MGARKKTKIIGIRRDEIMGRGKKREEEKVETNKI
jgi:hypothetical protein